MRTILFSTERVTANNAEAGLFIAFLLVWALSASYYVLQHGLAVRGGWTLNPHSSHVTLTCDMYSYVGTQVGSWKGAGGIGI